MIPDLRVPRVLAVALRRTAALAALATLALLSACDKVPLTAPSNATITLYSNTQIVPLNGTATITATVVQNGGSTVHNGTLVSFTSSLGNMDPAEAETKDGKVTVTFRAGTQSGTAVINAYSGGASTTASTSTGTTGTTGTTTGSSAGSGITLLVGSAAAASVVVTASPGTVPGKGGTSTITATVLDTNNNALPGVSVSFATDVGQVSPSSATTNSSGQAVSTLTTFQTATVTVTAAAKVTGTTKVSASPQPTVTITAPSTSPTAGIAATFSITAAAGNGGAPITDVTISYGDGRTDDLGQPNGATTVSHIYRDEGTYTVRVVATDATGQTSQASTPITVLAAQPFTLTVTASNGRVGASIGVTAIATAGSGAPSITSYTWDFGDGTPKITTTAPATSHVYTSIPAGFTSWTYTIQVTATGSDGRQGFGSTSVTITP
jgi:hypothetical protein